MGSAREEPETGMRKTLHYGDKSWATEKEIIHYYV